MELQKAKAPLEFKYHDVIVFVKPEACDADKMEIWAAGQVANGKIEMKKSDLIKATIKQFVVDWKGVTENGEPVPYSFEILMTRFPAHDKDSLCMKLYLFINTHTRIWETKEDQDSKKG